jgi:hypothetical protein
MCSDCPRPAFVARTQAIPQHGQSHMSGTGESREECSRYGADGTITMSSVPSRFAWPGPNSTRRLCLKITV